MCIYRYMCFVFDVHIYWKTEAGKLRVPKLSCKAPKEKPRDHGDLRSFVSNILLANLLGGLSVSFVKPVCQFHWKYNSIYVGGRGATQHCTIYTYSSFHLASSSMEMALICGFHWGYFTPISGATSPDLQLVRTTYASEVTCLLCVFPEH